MITPQGYTSVYEIIERVYDTFDSEDVNFAAMVRHISDALLLIGSFSYMENKVESITIENNRGELPCDIVYINQTRLCNNGSYYPLRYATESFHSRWHDNDSPDLRCESEYTYSLNGNMIYTSFKEGTVEIEYRAMPVDKNGYPLIPNDIKFKMAVEYHVLHKIAQKLFMVDKITNDKFHHITQERDFYVGAAQTRGNMLSYDQMESLANGLNRLVETSSSHSKFYKGLQNPENIKIHPR